MLSSIVSSVPSLTDRDVENKWEGKCQGSLCLRTSYAPHLAQFSRVLAEHQLLQQFDFILQRQQSLQLLRRTAPTISIAYKRLNDTQKRECRQSNSTLSFPSSYSES